MDMNKEKWIEEVMSSLDDVKSAELNPFIYSKILQKVQSKKTASTPTKLVWLIAASFLLLLFFNLHAIKRTSVLSEKKTDVQELASQFDLLNANTVNY